MQHRLCTAQRALLKFQSAACATPGPSTPFRKLNTGCAAGPFTSTLANTGKVTWYLCSHDQCCVLVQ